jgi:hypothetical protein
VSSVFRETVFAAVGEKMKSLLAIKREYGRANRYMLRFPGNQDLRGARQALAWVLEDNAMAPVKAAGIELGKKKGKASR